MKITKQAKPIKLIWKETRSYTSEYTCPSCHTTFIGHINTNGIIRFRCDCGQELKIVEQKEVKLS